MPLGENFFSTWYRLPALVLVLQFLTNIKRTGGVELGREINTTPVTRRAVGTGDRGVMVTPYSGRYVKR